MKNRILLIFIFLFCLLNLAFANAYNIEKFISVADIHFDPYSSCSKFQNHCDVVDKLQKANYQDWPKIFEQYGEKQPANHFTQETNYPLFMATLYQLQKLQQQLHPTFVIILGDFLAHDFRKRYIKYTHDKSREGYQRFVKKTMQFMTSGFVDALPNINIYPVVGNNDSYTGNYSSVPRGQFFKDMSVVWSDFIKDPVNRENFIREFPTAGYYHVHLPDSQNQLIILNSVLFSCFARDAIVKPTALEQLNWLHDQLQKAKANHEQVLLAYHIPVGINIWDTIQIQFKKVMDFWKPLYTEKFEKELLNSPLMVTGLLAGHVHIDVFQAMSLKKFADVPIYLTPSISPNYGNHPGFKIYRYNPVTLKLDAEPTFLVLDNGFFN